MIHDPAAWIAWCIFLFVAFKLGQAHEVMCNRRRMLEGRGSSAAVVDGTGSPAGPDGHHETVGERQGRQPRPSSIFDQEAEPANGLVLTLLGRTVKAK